MMVVKGEERRPFPPLLYTYSTIAWGAMRRPPPETSYEPLDVMSMSRGAWREGGVDRVRRSRSATGRENALCCLELTEIPRNEIAPD